MGCAGNKAALNRLKKQITRINLLAVLYVHVYQETGTGICDGACLRNAAAADAAGIGMLHEYEAFRRAVLRAGEEMQWVKNWEKTGRSVYLAFIQDSPQRPTLFPGLSDLEKITPAQAVKLLFVMCMGHDGSWSPALDQWYQETLEKWGLEEESGFVSSYDLCAPLSEKPEQVRVHVSHFLAEIPEALQEAFAHPRLEGWQCLGGALREYMKVSDYESPSIGLAMFGQGEKRLLVMLHKKNEGAKWRLFPVAQLPFLSGRPIRVRADMMNPYFYLEMPTEEGGWESIAICPMLQENNKALCQIQRYTGTNSEKGEGFQVWHEEFWQYKNDGAPQKSALPGTLLGFLDFIGDGSLPKTLEECLAFSKAPIPPGYEMIQGVHLRQQPSSHSGDLGMFQRGAIVEVLEKLPGSAAPWYHVKIGPLEGYMSGNYVGNQIQGTDAQVQYQPPLSVGQCKKDAVLWADTRLFSPKAAELKAGARMHILARRGDYWYVSVPEGPVGQYMDVNGTYGFVHEKDLLLAGSALQLDWMTP